MMEGGTANPLWLEFFEGVDNDLDRLSEAVPQGVEQELADTQGAAGALTSFLASDDADSSEQRPMFAALVADLRFKGGALSAALRSRCV